MNHSFVESVADKNICATCKYNFKAHTKMASCETCDYMGDKVEIYKSRIAAGKSMLMCPQCIKNEDDATEKFKSEKAQGLHPGAISKVDEHLTPLQEAAKEVDLIAQSMELDSSIRFSGDIFNAATVPIMELKAIIDNDDSIPADKKAVKLAEVVRDRFTHFKQALFDTKNLAEKLEGTLIAHQRYLNNLVSMLKAEYRTEFKEHDIHYTPPEPVKKPTAPKIKLSAEDKIVASYAKMMKIDFDVAKKKMKENGMI